jgi:hypothetical protein
MEFIQLQINHPRTPTRSYNFPDAFIRPFASLKFPIGITPSKFLGHALPPLPHSQSSHLESTPSVPGLGDDCLEGVSAADQKPRQTDLNPTWTRTNEKGIEFGVGFPWSASLKGSGTKGRSYTFPAQTVGLDVDRILIRRWKTNHFLWRYPVTKATEPFKEGPLDQSARFSNHSGKFYYLNRNVPSSMNFELAVNYQIPGRSVFIQNNGKNYPCRSLLFKLEVKILPNEMSQFIYPRDGSSGTPLNLGTFRFAHDPDGHPVLQISHDGVETSIPDPHLNGALPDQSHGPAWSTQKVGPGTYKTKDSDGDQGISSVGGELDMSLRNWK